MKEDRGDVLRSPDAVGSGRRLAGIGLQPGNETLEIIGRHDFLCDNQDWLRREWCDGFEICEKVVRKRIGNAVRYECAPVAERDSVAIVCRPRDPADPDAAPSAGHVFDHYWLAQRCPHALSEYTANRIRARARWERHYDRDGTCRIGLCPRHPRHGRHRGSAGGKMQKISAGKFHGALPEARFLRHQPTRAPHPMRGPCPST